MKSKKKAPSKKFEIILSVLVAILLAGHVYMLAKQNYEENDYDDHKAINVELGSYEYEIEDGKATKLDNEKIKTLRQFLIKSAKKDLEFCDETHYIVNIYNENREQVLIHYGCENPNSRMFAVLESGKWKFISPTNQFDMLGIPLCSHVDDNDIDKSIAPVCYVETGDEKNPLAYKTR